MMASSGVNCENVFFASCTEGFNDADTISGICYMGAQIRQNHSNLVPLRCHHCAITWAPWKSAAAEQGTLADQVIAQRASAYRQHDIVQGRIKGFGNLLETLNGVRLCGKAPRAGDFLVQQALGRLKSTPKFSAFWFLRNAPMTSMRHEEWRTTCLPVAW